MPRLRRQSVQQRASSNRQLLLSFREQNFDSDRLRNSQLLASRRRNEEYRENERQLDRDSRATRRLNRRIRSIEQEHDSFEHSLHREDDNVRAVEQERNTLEHSIRREDPNIRVLERTRDTLSRSVRRSNPALRASERARDARLRLTRRLNPRLRAVEQERNTLEHSTRRENPNIRVPERARDARLRSIRREDPNIRVPERARDARLRSSRRLNPRLRAVEQERNTLEHSIRREDPNIRVPERARDAQLRSTRRLNPRLRAAEQERNTLEHSIRREDPNIRVPERARDAAARTIRRSNPIFRTIEQSQNSLLRRASRQESRNFTHDLNRMMNCRVRIYRANPVNRANENSRQADRNRQNRRDLSPESRSQALAADSQRQISAMLLEFNNNVKKGPVNICVCCGGLYFPNQIKTLNKCVFLRKYSNLSEVFFLSSTFPSENNIYKFCNTCHRTVNNGKVPSICLSKGLNFPVIPDELKGLTPLEERFVAPRIPFMRIVSLGYNRQCAVRGAVVNIPISLSKTVEVLPRTFDQTEVIQVHLKRRMEFNHSFMTETVRPSKILAAARYLINTELYRSHNITMSEEWLDNVGLREEVPFISNRADEELVNVLVNEDSEEDIVNELNPQETLMENNPVENIPLNRISIAPGEGQRPLDLLLDKDSEELSFPTIYCGVRRVCDATIGQIIRSEAKRWDRRCARIDKVLYNSKKFEQSKIQSSISTCLRKKFGHPNYTARDLIDDGFVQNLIQHDEGYHILKGIRSSPAHWEGEKKKVLAMIRQFGLPTFFITLSAAEPQWPELIVILAKVLENREITEDEAMSYTTLDKYNLIRTDPITCARYFDQRIRHLFKHFKVNGGVFDEYKVVKFYWRIEFQQRGSPHVHGIFWVENAPQLNVEEPTSFPSVINFIDRFITTDSTIEEVQNYISYQQHNHTRTCQREIRGKNICRFHIPYPPLPNTEILLPLPEDIEANELERHKNNFEKVQTLLNARLSNDEVSLLNSFEQFLSDERISISNEDYILALRSSLKKPKIFLKRSFKDRSINAFNPNILKMQRANMDIQFVMDAYACVSYIVNYINKSHRGVSRLLQEAMDEVRAGNFSVKQRLQHIGNKFISASEVSAQEASYNILGLHLSESSNSEVFINTFVPEKRVRMVKSRQELERLAPDSTDIFRSGLIDHYIQRPDILENECLAHFAAYFSFSKTLRRNQIEPLDDYDEDDEVDIDAVGVPLRLKNNSGYVYRRKSAAIIRFPSFNVDTSRGDYFRALCMLYFPWRDECADLLEYDNEERCSTERNLIEANRLEFEIFKEGELEDILQRVQEDDNVGPINQLNNVAATQLLDEEFRALVIPEVVSNFNVLNIDQNQNNDNNNSNDDIRLIRLPPLISEIDLLTSLRTLNVKQRLYLQHLLQNIVQNEKFCEYVGGGAGVGKSRLIRTIYQSITYRFNSVPGANPDLPKVLLSAPTGKAAFGIGGCTLHSLFSLPINQNSGEIRPLSNDAVNSLLAKLIDLKLLIIDEISMVGSRMFGHLDSRLKQVYKSTLPFGGISVLVFGDLKQLSPVGDRWIFSSNPANPYGVIIGGGLWDLFSFFELTDIMRQREDISFAQALNNMAVGQMTEEDINLLQSRVFKSNGDVPSDAIHLFMSNAEAETHNKLRMSQILTDEFTSKSFDIIKTDSLSIVQRTGILNSAYFRKMKTSETQGLCLELQLKTSAKYMMTVNINTSDGLVNGASGVLMAVGLQRDTRKPTILWMHFADENVGTEARRKNPHAMEPFWTPIEKCVRTFQYKTNRQITIERKQFPLVVAEGITIHKSQGATYSKVVVHTRGRMQRSALYVACSRATSATGLFIVDRFNPPNPFQESDPVNLELQRLRIEKNLYLQHQFLTSNEFQLTMYYQNIQSLQAHYQDVLSDSTILSQDIICFVETWTFPEEEHVLTDYSILGRLDSFRVGENQERFRSRRGVIVYIKSSKLLESEFLFKRDHTIRNSSFQYIVIRYKQLYFIILYRNIDYPEGTFRTLLTSAIHEVKQRAGTENVKIFIIGDFNICRRTIDSPTEALLNRNGYYSILEKVVPTTNHGTHIDWAFTNISVNTVKCKTYATLHSHHDGIIFGANI